MNTTAAVIDVNNLAYSYGHDEVLRGLDLCIEPGTIIGLCYRQSGLPQGLVDDLGRHRRPSRFGNADEYCY